MDSEKKKLISRYNYLHGKLLWSVDNALIKVAALIREMDYKGIENRLDRNLKELDLIEKEVGKSSELEELRSLTFSLFQPKVRKAANHPVV